MNGILSFPPEMIKLKEIVKLKPSFEILTYNMPCFENKL